MLGLRMTAFVACVSAAAAIGCGAHYVTRGADLYASGYYVEAAEVFEQSERRLDRLSPPDRARYGLYRGATLLALGDSLHAARWLEYCQAITQRDGDALSEDEHLMLSRALLVLGSREPKAPPPGEAAAVAAGQGEAPSKRRVAPPLPANPN